MIQKKDTWENTTWGSIATLEYGKSLRDYHSNGPVPVFGTNGKIGYTDKALCASEGIIIGRKGAYRGVHYSNLPFFVIDTAFFLKPKKKIDIKWAYYALKCHDINELDSGSAIPSTSRDDFYNLKAVLPPLAEQKAIAAVLSSLDDKIDLLHRQNATLERMAETLFRQWFIEEAEEDWDKCNISDIAHINKHSVDRKIFSDEIKYLETGDINSGAIQNLSVYALQDAPSREKRIAKHNDIIFSLVRPNQKHYGLLKNPPQNLVVSTGFCVLTCKKIDPHFLYLALTTNEMTEYLHSIAEGSTSAYPSLKPSDIENLQIILPPHYILDKFSKYAVVVWEKIAKNQQQIRTLEKLRDTLLPKLMSGEVRVRVAE